MRTMLIWMGAAFVLGNFYVMVAQKEALLRNGQTVYLELAPVDPRSVMQGDYMALNYAVMNHLNMDHFDSPQIKQPPCGRIIILLDHQNVGRFVRYDQGMPPASSEHLLKYHHSGWQAVIGAESYFIPEGAGATFAKAAYGELKVEPDGTPLIVALCDKDFHRIVATP